MKTPIPVAALLVLLTACGGDGGEAVVVEGPRLAATLVGGERDEAGRLHVIVPFRKEVPLSLRVTNTGDVPVQVPRSSLPFFYFVKLEVVRLDEDGSRTPVKPYFDLYPLKDMMPPTKEFVTLRPGEWMDRSLDVLIREAHGLHTLFQHDVFNNCDRLLREGFGKIRTPGIYEVTGRYSPDPTFLDGKPHDIFSGESGRDATIAVWEGGAAVTAPLLLVMEETW